MKLHEELDKFLEFSARDTALTMKPTTTVDLTELEEVGFGLGILSIVGNDPIKCMRITFIMGFYFRDWLETQPHGEDAGLKRLAEL